ncbi:Tautomerase/MIF [Gloeophyllum trabeum ATCC 11539]|uniref:L-dopachrome isomerase n=1 Tax=Gloeophyllum trabeum (strain ATCC 11539 / FP-39264 / Madison 617) TaxID=670483 RepID=S7RYY1_GLOTA|nr:Tautomerase/MIF [Gloeophyllum trabeum ATCC 11539]EPQ58634.1 Tautomerase/MIF [Gloeophyllum trabeum ATCC 11539]
MPALVITTNVKVPDIRVFIVEFSKFAAETLSKPEQYISVSYNYDENLSFHGTFDPAFLMVITSLNNINPEANEKYSKAFFGHFKERLGVPGERGYITFYDPGLAYLGHKATTFQTLFGS